MPFITAEDLMGNRRTPASSRTTPYGLGAPAGFGGGYGGGGVAGGVAGGGGGYGGGDYNPYQNEWFPGLYQNLFERMGAGEEASFGQLQNLMGYNVGQLGRTLGSQMGRMNMPMAGGWGMAANRFMAPMQTQMQNWMQTQKMPWSQKVGTTLQMAQQFAPMFEANLEPGEYWKQVMNKFMKELFGGGGK